MRENSFLCVSRRKVALIFRKEFKLKSKFLKTTSTYVLVILMTTTVKLSKGLASRRKEVLQILEESNEPLSILAVKKRTGLGSWLSAKNILLELLLQDKVTCKRGTSRNAFLFTINVKVTIENDKFVFTTVVNGKKKTASLPAKDIHIYLRKSNEAIVVNFRKVFGITIDAGELKEKILKLLKVGKG